MSNRNQNNDSARGVATDARVFCKGCGYALIGLESNKCPECGREFDLNNRRTFARKPRRGRIWYWGKRVLAVVLALTLAAATGFWWLWQGWAAEQSTIARMRTTGQQFTIRSIGPGPLRSVLGARFGYLTERVDTAMLTALGAVDREQIHFRTLTNIETLALGECELSNSQLNDLYGLPRLRDLRLFRLNGRAPDLAFLESLPSLEKLELTGMWVPHSGLQNIARLQRLKVLALRGAGIDDFDLRNLKDLSSLKELEIWGNFISDDGLESLYGLKSLRILRLEKRFSAPSVAKLKEAIPGLRVYDESGRELKG